MSNIIELKNVNKWFDKFQVLKEINLEVKPKEKIVVCGPSGSGKSTLIRCINRLEEHQEGSIVVDGKEISEKTKNIENISWSFRIRCWNPANLMEREECHDIAKL